MSDISSSLNIAWIPPHAVGMSLFRQTTFVICLLFLVCSCLFCTIDGLYTPLTTSLRMRVLGVSSSFPSHVPSHLPSHPSQVCSMLRNTSPFKACVPFLFDSNFHGRGDIKFERKNGREDHGEIKTTLAQTLTRFSDAMCRPLLPNVLSLRTLSVLGFHSMPRARTWKVPQRTDHFLNASAWNFSSLFSDSNSGKNNTLSRKDVSKRAVKAWARSTSPGRPRADEMWVFH